MEPIKLLARLLLFLKIFPSVGVIARCGHLRTDRGLQVRPLLGPCLGACLVFFSCVQLLEIKRTHIPLNLFGCRVRAIASKYSWR